MTAVAIIVLAAGKGTRMKSKLPKVLHKAAGRSLMAHALSAARELRPNRTIIVTGPDMEAVAQEARTILPDAAVVIQAERIGTGHAVSQAIPELANFHGTVVIAYADVPLIAAETLKQLANLVSSATPLAILGFKAVVPKGYGRLLRDSSGKVSAIREELDASIEERKIDLCNSGIMAAEAALLRRLLPNLRPNNAKGELYLTDLVGLASAEGTAAGLAVCSEDEVQGVNDRIQLAQIERRLQQRYRHAAMENGATLVAPETVFFSHDTRLGRDVLVEPNVIFGPGVTVADDVVIMAGSHIEGADIKAGARIGPYARLRPGAVIGEDAHIGNFVEVKKAVIERGAKANHLTYIGDARVGANSNIGAGTITANYNGYEKQFTSIGAGASIGSNVVLVAPVKIGDGANVGAGSVITKDVEADELAFTRGPLEIKKGWAKRFRAAKEARKKTKS